MKIFLMFILLSMIAFPCYSETFTVPKTIFDSINKEDQNDKEVLLLRKYFKGNFTNSGYSEYIAFYYPKNDDSRPLFEKVIIYIENEGKIIKQYSIIEWVFFNYNAIAQKSIKELETLLGEWNGYFYQFDLNKNGINEIILFPYGGTGLFLKVYEFKDGQFVSLANSDKIQISKVFIDVALSAFTLYTDYEYEAHKKGYKGFFFKWNPQTNKYDIIKKQEGVFP